MKRAIGLLVLIFAVTLFGAYVSSVRANGQQTPCDGGDGSAGTNWKWLYCHQGHTICVGDSTEDVGSTGVDPTDNTTGHTEHGIDHPGNPPKGCFFLGCCSQGGPEGNDCKKGCEGKGCTTS
jgi:hypothetical protein